MGLNNSPASFRLHRHRNHVSLEVTMEGHCLHHYLTTKQAADLAQALTTIGTSCVFETLTASNSKPITIECKG
jgi:hypothetical protein